MRMNVFGKVLCVFLACLLLGGCLSGCTGKKQPVSTQEGTMTADEDNPEELPAEDFSDADGLPREFNMLVRASRYRYLYATAEDSDTVAKSAYDRNTKIEERFGVEFSITEVADAAANWNTFLTGATGEYDLACFDYLYRVEEMGLLYNVLDLSEITLSDPWWYKGWNDVGTVNGQLYSVAGDASNEMIENMGVIFFNKKIAQDNGFALYDLVDSGSWTLEEMRMLSTQIASGLDDNDPTNNVYGAMFDLHSIRMTIACFGLTLVQPTENGFYELVYDSAINERNWNAILAFQDFVRNSNSVQYDGSTCRARETDTFTTGRSLFFSSALLVGERIKNKVSGWQYGILPYPKYQLKDEYLGTVYGCSVFGIPKSVSDVHCSAVILNALNYYGASSNINAFYEKTIAGKVTESPDDLRMLELVRSNIVVDFAFIHDENVMTLFQRYAWAVTNGDNPATVFSENCKTAEAGLASILKAYQK